MFLDLGHSIRASDDPNLQWFKKKFADGLSKLHTRDYQ
jgi:hypothetical protein